MVRVLQASGSKRLRIQACQQVSWLHSMQFWENSGWDTLKRHALDDDLTGTLPTEAVEARRTRSLAFQHDHRHATDLPPALTIILCYRSGHEHLDSTAHCCQCHYGDNGVWFYILFLHRGGVVEIAGLSVPDTRVNRTSILSKHCPKERGGASQVLGRLPQWPACVCGRHIWNYKVYCHQVHFGLCYVYLVPSGSSEAQSPVHGQ